MFNPDLEKSMLPKIGEEWYSYLKEEINEPYFISLGNFIANRRSVTTVYPTNEEIFNAYKLCQPSNIKVVCLGQDCYINGEAHGLAFSVKEGVPATPSINKIKEAIESSVYNGLNLNWSNDLTRWAQSGVFLLNTILTVDKSKSLSHEKRGWEKFTLATIETINLNLKNVVFLLFGNYAREYRKYINSYKHLIIECEHPVAASYNNREWKHNNCWNLANKYLSEHNKEKIIW